MNFKYIEMDNCCSEYFSICSITDGQQIKHNKKESAKGNYYEHKNIMYYTYINRIIIPFY